MLVAQGRESQRRNDWPFMDLMLCGENLANTLLSVCLEWRFQDAAASARVWWEGRRYPLTKEEGQICLQQLMQMDALFRDLVLRFFWEHQTRSLPSEYEWTSRNIRTNQNHTGFCCLLPSSALSLGEQIENSGDASRVPGEGRRLAYPSDAGARVGSRPAVRCGLSSCQNPKKQLL